MSVDYPSEPDPDERLTRDLVQIVEASEDDPRWLLCHSDEVCAPLRKGLASGYHYGRAADALFAVLALVMTDPSWQAWFEPIAALVEQHSLREGNLFEAGLREVMGDFRPVLGRFGQISSLSPLVVEDMLHAYTKLFGVIFYRQAQPIPQRLLDQALAVAKRLDDRLESARLNQTIAQLYNVKGEYALATTFGKQAFANYGSVGDYVGMADAACTLSCAYRSSQRSRQAYAYVHRAVEQIPEGKVERSFATLYYEHGVVCYRLDELDDALKYYRKALAIFEEYRAEYQIAMTQQAMALAYVYCGDFAQAQALLECARAAWEQLGIKYEWVNTFFAEAQLEFRRGQPVLARRLLDLTIEKALDRLESTPARDELIELIHSFITDNDL